MQKTLEFIKFVKGVILIRLKQQIFFFTYKHSLMAGSTMWRPYKAINHTGCISLFYLLRVGLQSVVAYSFTLSFGCKSILKIYNKNNSCAVSCQ